MSAPFDVRQYKAELLELLDYAQGRGKYQLALALFDFDFEPEEMKEIVDRALLAADGELGKTDG